MIIGYWDCGDQNTDGRYISIDTENGDSFQVGERSTDAFGASYCLGTRYFTDGTFVQYER